MAKPYSYQPAGQFDSTTTGNIDDLDFSKCALIRMNNATAATIRGLKAGFDGQRVVIHNVGTSTVRAAHQDTGSVAANRIVGVSARGQIIGGGGSINLMYDATLARWLIVAVNPGTAITITFNAAHFTGEGGGTWTVASGDVRILAYTQNGRLLTLQFGVVATTITVGTCSVLVWDFATATGFTITNIVDSVGWCQDNGTAIAGRIVMLNSAGTLRALPLLGGTWALSTDLTNVTLNTFFTVD